MRKSMPSCKGSMTVEAVLLFPMLFFVILSFLYLTLYQYDSILLHSVIDKAILLENQALKQPLDWEQGGVCYEQFTNRSLVYEYTSDFSKEEEACKQYIQKELEEELMISEVSSISVEASQSEITATVVLDMRISMLGVLEYVGDHNKIVAKVSLPTHNPSEFARIAKNTLDVVMDIKGMDKLLEGLKKFIEIFQ